MAKLSDTVKCECSSDFIPILERDLQSCHCYCPTHQYINYGMYDRQCTKCNYFFYLDPQYENMLYDLRSMNIIW